ncbi:uncharacterized protein M6G45_016108 [Spheniscus humboldti]
MTYFTNPDKHRLHVHGLPPPRPGSSQGADAALAQREAGFRAFRSTLGFASAQSPGLPSQRRPQPGPDQESKPRRGSSFPRGVARTAVTSSYTSKKGPSDRGGIPAVPCHITSPGGTTAGRRSHPAPAAGDDGTARCAERGGARPDEVPEARRHRAGRRARIRGREYRAGSHEPGLKRTSGTKENTLFHAGEGAPRPTETPAPTGPRGCRDTSTPRPRSPRSSPRWRPNGGLRPAHPHPARATRPSGSRRTLRGPGRRLRGAQEAQLPLQSRPESRHRRPTVLSRKMETFPSLIPNQRDPSTEAATALGASREAGGVPAPRVVHTARRLTAAWGSACLLWYNWRAIVTSRTIRLGVPSPSSARLVDAEGSQEGRAWALDAF